MIDVIQLLPESVANQIAAGEVVQRPASVVKELLENSIDAGASEIKLILKDAGKTLIQVVDNGCGMSENDARMSFERHATSKIRASTDLFSIRTMGFRGEALASIAAVAQVELRTKRATDELGVRVVIEDSRVLVHEPCQCTVGTNLSIKNLFFNVPARRNFLKSDTVEIRHIIDEFQRVAMAHPDLFFSLHHNGQELFHLVSGNLRQRIVKIFGESINKKLVPVSEDTEVLKISGFVGKPDYSKKSRGEQFFFVNNRFIKSSYLNHAVQGAYEDLLAEKSFPLYVIFLEIDPKHVDINVHPTKQEIKFDDEKLVYNYLKVAIRHALGHHNVMPTLDFEAEQGFRPNDHRMHSRFSVNRNEEEKGTFMGNTTPNTSNNGSNRSLATPSSEAQRQASNLRNWQRMFEGLDDSVSNNQQAEQEILINMEDVATKKQQYPAPHQENSITIESRATSENAKMDDESGSFSKIKKEPYQIHSEYIISQIRSGYVLIDQAAASERILYERYLNSLKKQVSSTQKLLFPKTIHLAPADAQTLLSILPEVNKLGFELSEFGDGSFILHGFPAELSGGKNEQGLIESLVAQYVENMEFQLGIQENLARSLARSSAVRRGQPLTTLEMQNLIDKLFACEMPYKSPSGRKCFITYELEDIFKQLS